MMSKKAETTPGALLVSKYISERIKKSLAVHPPKYQDPRTGKTWSGRGRAPTWIEGKNRDQFLIQKSGKTD